MHIVQFNIFQGLIKLNFLQGLSNKRFYFYLGFWFQRTVSVFLSYHDKDDKARFTTVPLKP